MDRSRDPLPFDYFENDLNPNSSPEDTLRVYRQRLAAVEHTLGRKTTEDGAPPHDMIMDRDRIAVIPRQASDLGPVGINAGGMLGMIWTHSDEEKQRWLKTGTWNVMKEAGCPELL